LRLLVGFNQALDRVLTFIAGVALVSMILLTCSNIFLRSIWLPIKGTFELLGFLGAVAATFALGYTQRYRMHIAVNVLVDRFSSRTREVLTVVNNLMCMVFFAIAGWQIAKWSTVFVETGEVTETLQIIYYPFTYATALGCLALSLSFFTETMQTIFTKKEEPS